MHRQGRTRYAVISPSIAGISQDNFAFKIQVDITLRKEESCHTRDSARDGHVHLGVKSIVDKCRHQVVLPAPLQKPSLVSAVRNEDAPSFCLRDCKFLLSSQVSEGSRVNMKLIFIGSC
ncbi:hypothetical protein OUZ56_027792 [Daphnia magna]|uniref:Uncharacterized protein n=1 Tax=Daphnia magna TaxID=35525 RepID=A0ABR0B1X9_9CRUS|nr:hypothetical protein OUZ56_027792 [Daphnia magna]